MTLLTDWANVITAWQTALKEQGHGHCLEDVLNGKVQSEFCESQTIFLKKLADT